MLDGFSDEVVDVTAACLLGVVGVAVADNTHAKRARALLTFMICL
jgi:hypothetical protein